MATGVTSALADSWLNVLRNTAPTLYGTTLYAKLYTGDPGAAGTSNAAVGDTTRQSFTFAAPSGNALALTSAPAAYTNGGTSETITHIGIWSASTSGTFLVSAALSSSQAWASGNQFTLTAFGLALAGIAA